MSKKLSIVSVHDYPSFAQYEFARRATELIQTLHTWDAVAKEMRDERGVHADPRGCELAAAKWADSKGYYTAYWEIGMTQDAPFQWHVRFMAYDGGRLLDERTGSAFTEEEARRASQQYVLDNIERFRVEATV